MPETLSILLSLVMTGGLLAGAGLLMLWLARRSERGLLKRNQIAGVRTPLTLSSDVAWYPAQHAAAPRTKIAGWGAIVGGAATASVALWGLSFNTAMIVCTVLTLASAAWLLSWVLAGAATAQRAAKDAVAAANPHSSDR